MSAGDPCPSCRSGTHAWGEPRGQTYVLPGGQAVRLNRITCRCRMCLITCGAGLVRVDVDATMPIPITEPRVPETHMAPDLLTKREPSGRRGRLGTTGEPAMEATKENLEKLIEGIRRL